MVRTTMTTPRDQYHNVPGRRQFIGGRISVTGGGVSGLPPLELGNGFNALMVVEQPDGSLAAEWVDLLQFFRLDFVDITESLSVPVPGIADSVTEADAGDGGQDSNTSISAPIPGIMESATQASAAPSTATDTMSAPVPSITPTVVLV